VYVDDAVVKT
jgi:hypothetical protein